MSWEIEQTLNRVEMAEAKLSHDRDLTWRNLSEDDKDFWMFILLDLSDCFDCFGDVLPEDIKKRILHIQKSYPEPDEISTQIITDLAIEKLDEMR